VTAWTSPATNYEVAVYGIYAPTREQIQGQIDLWQEWLDRLAVLPEDLAERAERAITQALRHQGGLGGVHKGIRAAIVDAEDRHWKRCAEWLLAERDWERAHPKPTINSLDDLKKYGDKNKHYRSRGGEGPRWRWDNGYGWCWSSDYEWSKGRSFSSADAPQGPFVEVTE
jgi:hypothetical protein